MNYFCAFFAVGRKQLIINSSTASTLNFSIMQYI